MAPQGKSVARQIAETGRFFLWEHVNQLLDVVLELAWTWNSKTVRCTSCQVELNLSLEFPVFRG